MRHRRKFNHLSRTSAHRRAMLSNMATSLILHKRITTTVAKAKALRTYVEPLITRSKEDTTHSRRMVFSYLQSKEAVNELFREISVKIADRPGGYTRIIKMGNRVGDNADMALIELVDYNEHLLDTAGPAGEEKSTGRRRKRRGSGKGKSETQATDQPEQKAKKPVAAPVEEEEEKSADQEEPKAKAAQEQTETEQKNEETKAEVAEQPKAEAKEEETTEEKPEEDKKEEDKK
ncbi:MAG: 50S ribosomal protein L17 [Bacteroidales bacterium]